MLVLVNDLQVDDIVHGHVGKAWVLVPQMLPSLEMAIQLVANLMQDKEAELWIVEAVTERTSIHLITSVGVGCWRCLADTLLAQHEDTSQRDVSVLAHDIDHTLVEPLLGGQLLTDR